MKSRIESSICAILCILPSICFGQAQMTVDECVATAVAHNRSILLSQQSVVSASGRVTEAKGAGNPKLNAFGNASRRSEEQNLPLVVGLDPNQNLVIQNVPLVPSSASSGGVALTQVLDVSGIIRTGIRVARLGEQSARLDVGRTRNDVVLETKLTYYDVLRNEELVAVAQEAMRNAGTRKQAAQALVDAGINSKVDVIRADASISAAQQSIISAQNAVQVSKSVLNGIMGREISAPIELEKPGDTAFQVATYKTYLDEALAHRPEVAIASTSTAASKQRYKLAKRGMSPSVVLSAAAQINDAHDVPEDKNATVGLAVVFPLFDGGETRGRTKQAAANIESSLIAEEETRAQIALQVNSAYVHVQNAGEKLATANKELDQATESLRLSQSRYEEGIASQVELSDAELLFTQAQTSVVNARFEQLGSQAELERALGKHAGQN